ncbi:MAG: quinate 5-dehydrogenase [Halanaerobiaceae bacterium]
MKKVLSISLGSSTRDHKVETEIMGENFLIERRGVDGDKKKARKLFSRLDGKYDAFGLGGIDLHIFAAGRKYTFTDARKLIKEVKSTPVVDGSGLKNTLERKVINYLEENCDLDIAEKTVLMVSAVDRFGMAETFSALGADLILGDIVFGLGLPFPIKRVKTLEKLAVVLAPIITKLPFELIYPTGLKQEQESKKRFTYLYEKADIIAGDFHYIRKYIPDRLDDKVIITNTITSGNLEEFRNRGVKMLVTTTPELNGRSFGTNVMEAVFVSLLNKPLASIVNHDYFKLLEEINFRPRVLDFKSHLAS